MDNPIIGPIHSSELESDIFVPKYFNPKKTLANVIVAAIKYPASLRIINHHFPLT